MKERKVLDQIKLHNQQSTDTRSLEKFRQMQQFIDASIQNALAQDGAEKVATLTTALLNLRDFLASDIFENSFKLTLLKNIEHLEQQEEDAITEDKQDEVHKERPKKKKTEGKKQNRSKTSASPQD